MEVIAPGTEVYICPDKAQTGHVLKTLIEGAACHVSYACVWWAGTERKESWFQAFEVSIVGDVPAKRIGLMAGSHRGVE